MKCSNCNDLEGTVSGTIAGQYRSGLCRPCFSTMQAGMRPSSGHASYNRQRDFEDHQADIAQPYTKDGKPSRDFISLYPEQAKKMFNEKDLRQYG